MNYDDAIDEERRKMVSLSGAWFIVVTLTLSAFVLFYSYFLDDDKYLTVNSYSKNLALIYILFISTLWVIRTLNPSYLDKNWMRNASMLIFINGLIWGALFFVISWKTVFSGQFFFA